MASRKIQVHKVNENRCPDLHKVETGDGGMDNPALDNHDTVRSIAELISNDAMAEEDVPPSPAGPVCSTPAPVKSNGAAPREQESGDAEDEEEVDIEEEGRVNFTRYLDNNLKSIISNLLNVEFVHASKFYSSETK